MAYVVIRCPKTGGEILTGYNVSRTKWKALELRDQRTQCPHCGELHRWEKKDAILRD